MKRLLNLVLLVLFLQNACCQIFSTDYSIAFYNVENLFDPFDDSLTNDDDFTPQGIYHWTYKKFQRKIDNISKVLISMGKGSPPAIVGLAEVENDFVLQQFCHQSPLKNYDYDFIHFDAPYLRGAEVALLYRKKFVHIINNEAIPIIFPFEKTSKNRDILYVAVQFGQRDTVHIFINHWTSRFGGHAATIPKRNYYASVLKHKVDSLLMLNPFANILIMGDFNDYPTDESVSEVLKAVPSSDQNKEAVLFNLMDRFNNIENEGSHKHEFFWGCLDQLIVSRSLLNGSNFIHIIDNQSYIYKADFMVVPDEKYGGEKVFRTFLGPRYLGGYADHLPVYLWLNVR